MNPRRIGNWVARNKGKTALIALGLLIFVWDWFALPRLILALALPLVFLLLPLAVLAAPIVIVVVLLRRRAARNALEGQAALPYPYTGAPQGGPVQGGYPPAHGFFPPEWTEEEVEAWLYQQGTSRPRDMQDPWGGRN